MVLLIDNYDSFVYNLARYITELGFDTHVVRNDAISLDEVRLLSPSHIVISPGPCTPTTAGISLEMIRHCGPVIPILGVCLGHQAIGQAYGGQVVKAPRPIHGKNSLIQHHGKDLFRGLPNPLRVGRYHSLVIDSKHLPETLEVTASTHDDVIMAVKHVIHPVFGVQFHPESVLTEKGYDLLLNFLTHANGQDNH